MVQSLVVLLSKGGVWIDTIICTLQYNWAVWIKKGMDLLLKRNQDKFLKKNYRNVKKLDRSWQSLTHRPSMQ